MILNDTISEQGDEGQQMGLRARKKRLAQTALEEAGLRLFQQQGYEQTSIHEITDAAMMSPRTFFRYFSSKEDLLFAPTQAALDEGIRYLQQVSSTESPRAALTTIFTHLAGLYQQQRSKFLVRYQIAMVTPSMASLYLYSLAATEPTLTETLCAQLATSMNQREMRFLVAIYMTAFRVALELWLEQETTGDLVGLLRENLERLSAYIP